MRNYALLNTHTGKSEYIGQTSWYILQDFLVKVRQVNKACQKNKLQFATPFYLHNKKFFKLLNLVVTNRCLLKLFLKKTKFVKGNKILYKHDFVLFTNFSVRLTNFILSLKKIGYKIVCKNFFSVY